MPSRARLAPALLAGLLLSSAGSATAATVRYDHDKQADFASFRTWAFGDTEWMRRLVDEDRFVDGYIRAALARELRGKGLQQVAPGEADLLVTFEGSQARRLEVDDDTYGPPFRSRWYRREIDVRSYDEGTLVVDLADRERGVLVWRGWLIDTVVQGRAREKRIDRGIERLLRKYPPPGTR